MSVAAIAAALSAACCFALAAILQQEAARTVDPGEALHLRLLADLLRRPRWLAGIAALVAGFSLQAVALANGPVSLVQPIIATELAFAIPVAIWRSRRRAGRREWAGIALVLLGISTFLVVASPRPGIAAPDLSDWLRTLVRRRWSSPPACRWRRCARAPGAPRCSARRRAHRSPCWPC
jgi:drug/metabolite transporter (DMT)-like permease